MGVIQLSLIEHTMFGRIDKVKIAIERIKHFEPLSMGLYDKPYQAAYSGGKDSDTIRILCILAGVPFDLIHNHTTADAPETVRYVRSIPGIQISYPKLSMWQLIVKKAIPPTKKARYCCEHLKEYSGKDRFVITGVRWAESAKRKAIRGLAEIQGSKVKNKLILNSDNDESRRLFETCTIKGKRILNPIVDWSEAEVWEFLDHMGCASNPLYQDGYKRIGCIGCPNSGCYGMKRDFERWPKYKDAYTRAFQRMVDEHNYAQSSKSWTSGEAVFDWWINEKQQKQIDGQESLW